jgi:hypothetical protein
MDEMSDTERDIRAVLAEHGIEPTDELVGALLGIAFDLADMVADNERYAAAEAAG